MKASRKYPRIATLVCASSLVVACTPPKPQSFRQPAVEYTKRLKSAQLNQAASETKSFHSIAAAPVVAAADINGLEPSFRASARLDAQLVNEDVTERPSISEGDTSSGSEHVLDENPDLVTNLYDTNQTEASYRVEQSPSQLTRDYVGPLNYGDPGLTASLWRESRGGADLYRDFRAFQPMDLITIVVSEQTEGRNQADTTIKQESTIQAAISNFLGLESTATKKNPQVDIANLVNAEASHDFKGEGETIRRGRLTGTISAMVAEVLPSGILRVEGEKIISVNSEEEIMVISGLIRPEDINSKNEVDSSKVANVRIDYRGEGTVGSAQTGGWLGNIMRKVWPF